MKIIDLNLNLRYDVCRGGAISPSNSNPEGLPKMKTVIRMFALFVAVAGLAFAAFAPAATQAQPRHIPIIASGPTVAAYPIDPCGGFCGAETTTGPDTTPSR
jgi:hypothetical protein